LFFYAQLGENTTKEKGLIMGGKPRKKPEYEKITFGDETFELIPVFKRSGQSLNKFQMKKLAEKYGANLGKEAKDKMLEDQEAIRKKFGKKEIRIVFTEDTTPGHPGCLGIIFRYKNNRYYEHYLNTFSRENLHMPRLCKPD